MLLVITVALTIILWYIINCCIDKSNDGFIITCIIGLFITAIISVSGGITLVANLITADSNQVELEQLYTQSIELIEAKEFLKYKLDFNEENFNTIVYEKVQAYNSLLKFCKTQNNSHLYGDFLNWDYCENYNPIIIKNNRDYILTS